MAFAHLTRGRQDVYQAGKTNITEGLIPGGSQSLTPEDSDFYCSPDLGEWTVESALLGSPLTMTVKKGDTANTVRFGHIVRLVHNIYLDVTSMAQMLVQMKDGIQGRPDAGIAAQPDEALIIRGRAPTLSSS